jgi:hypothetical protein
MSTPMPPSWQQFASGKHISNATETIGAYVLARAMNAASATVENREYMMLMDERWLRSRRRECCCDEWGLNEEPL